MTVEDASKNKVETSPDTNTTEQKIPQSNEKTAVLVTPFPLEQEEHSSASLKQGDEGDAQIECQDTTPPMDEYTPKEAAYETPADTAIASETKGDTESEVLPDRESEENTLAGAALAEVQVASDATVATPETSIPMTAATPSTTEWPVLVDTFSDGESAAKESAEDLFPSEEDTPETKDEKSKGLGGWSLLKGKSKPKEPATPKAGKKAKAAKREKNWRKNTRFLLHAPSAARCPTTTLP